MRGFSGLSLQRFRKVLVRAFPYLSILLFTAYFLRYSLAWFRGGAGGEDWDLFLFYLELVRKSFVEFREFPFWNAYSLGGFPVLANPNIRVLSPTVFLALIFGSLRALKISVILYYFLGGLGLIFLFKRVLRFSGLVALLCSTFILFSGYMPLHLFAGHARMYSFLLSFWALAFFLLSIKTAKKARQKKLLLFGSSFLLCIIYSESTLYLIIFYFFSLGLYALALFLFGFEDRYIFGKNLLLLVALFLVLSAYRLLPEALWHLQQGTQATTDLSSISLEQIWQIFTLPSKDPYVRNWSEQIYHWWEYGNYIGPWIFFVFLVSLFFSSKKDWPIWFVALFLLALMMGHLHPLFPGALLSHLPVFQSLRCHARWSYIFLVVFVMLLGLQLSRWEIRSRKRLSTRILYQFLLVGLFLYSFYDLQKVNTRLFQKLFALQLPNPALAKNFYTTESSIDYGAASGMYPNLRRNVATRSGYSILNLPIAVVSRESPIYKGEHYLLSSKKVVYPKHWSLNKIEFSLYSSKEDLLVINRNHYFEWTASQGHEVRNFEGLLAVTVQKGENQFSIYYAARVEKIGFAISLFGFLSIIAAFLKTKIWQKDQAT